MKRNRAEPAPPQTPAKTPRRYAGPNAHQKVPQKPQSGAAEESPPAPAPPSPSPAPAAEVVVVPESEWAPQLAGWDPAGEVAGAWSSWGVAEETLLGWFPFADEHFHGAAAPAAEAAAGAGPFWEEESFCCYYYHDDIWHLQHIHDVPKH